MAAVAASAGYVIKEDKEAAGGCLFAAVADQLRGWHVESTPAELRALSVRQVRADASIVSRG